MDLNLNSIDLETAEDGQWVEYADGIEFLIARAGNPKYNAALQRFYRRHKRAIEDKSMSDAAADAGLVDVMARHILLGWKGITDKGEPLEYSEANAKALLSDQRYAEVRAWITEQSNDVENYRAAYLKA